MGIGSGPGIASRASEPVINPETRIARTKLMWASSRRSSGRSLRRRERRQLPAQLLDLVAQLGGILEAELLRGREHLELEVDDHLLELLARHPLDLVPPPAARVRDVRLPARRAPGAA